MNVEKIQIDDEREIVIIDDSLDIGKIINLYYDCCQLPYRIENSSVADVQRICDRRLKCVLPDENPMTSILLEENSKSLKVIKKYIDSDEYGYSRGYVIWDCIQMFRKFILMIVVKIKLYYIMQIKIGR